MRKKRAVLTFLSVLFFALVGLGHGQLVHADNYQTNYTILKAGTGQTSYADAYFSKPASVSVNGDSYKVSITVSTDHSLGSFPVQILNVNGQTPQISKSTSGNRDNYVFTFNTKSVKKVMSGKMKVDINNINYHHVYGFNLRMDAGNVPALNSQQTQAQQASQKDASGQTTKNTTATANSSSSSSASSKSSSASSAVSNSGSSSSSSSSEKKETSSSKKASKKQESSKKESKKDDQPKAKQESHASSSTAWWIGGVVVVIVIGGVVYFVKNEYKK